MPMTPRQTALLARSLASLGKLSPQAQNSLIADAHRFRNPDMSLKLTPKTRKGLLRAYTIGDVFGRWQQSAGHPGYWANPTGLTFPHGPYRQIIDLLVKAGFTRFDHPWLPQETLTLKVMQTRSKEEWLTTPLCFLGTLPRGALEEIATSLGKSDRSRSATDAEIYAVTVHDLLTIYIEREGWPRYRDMSPYLLWRNREQSMTNTQKLLYKLGFMYEDSPVMQHNTDRKAIERLMKRHKIGERTARLVIRIARGESWHVRMD